MTELPGLEFEHREEIATLRDTLRRFVAREIAPRAADIDRSGQFPADLWKKLGDLGVLGITVEQAYGGSALGYLAHIVAMESAAAHGRTHLAERIWTRCCTVIRCMSTPPSQLSRRWAHATPAPDPREELVDAR